MFSLDNSEIKALVEGRFTTRECSECDKGVVFCDRESGMPLPYSRWELLDKEDQAFDECEDCSGLGFLIYFTE